MSSREYEQQRVTTGLLQQKYVQEVGQTWRQYVIGSVASIIVIVAGYIMGWTSPVNLKLQDVSQSPLTRPVTTDEEAWIGSVLTIGAMCGPFIASPIASNIGRKWTLIACSVPYLIGWILIIVANSVQYLYAGRVLWGLAIGMTYTVGPMYCTEIATIDGRGILGSYLALFVTIGFLAIYAIGPFLSYYALAYIGVAGILVSVVGMIFMPESPKYHLMKGNKNAAIHSLMVLRGRTRNGVEEELADLADELIAATQNTATISDLFKGTNFKAFYISCFLLFAQQFCGINAVLFYMTNIFSAAGAQVDPNTAPIIIGSVMLIAAVAMTSLVEKLGRKILLIISTIGTCVSLIALGVYFLLDYQKSPLTESLGLLPLISLIVYIVTYSFGLGPLPWALMSELLPMEVKAVASPIATAFCWILCFIITRYFGPVGAALGMHVVFWLFAGCCALALLFTIFVVPETKGHSALELQEILAGNKSKANLLDKP